MPILLVVKQKSFRDARLRKHADYQRVYKTGKRQSLPLMTFFFSPRAGGDGDSVDAGPRVGLTAGRVLGNAIERNRIKRRMRAAVRKHLDLLRSENQGERSGAVDVVLHPRRNVLDIEFAQIERDVVRAFRAVKAAL